MTIANSYCIASRFFNTEFIRDKRGGGGGGDGGGSAEAAAEEAPAEEAMEAEAPAEEATEAEATAPSAAARTIGPRAAERQSGCGRRRGRLFTAISAEAHQG